MGTGGRPFLRKLGLASINELANLICLCGSCHKKFDSFRLGIDPTEGMWTVNASERKDRPEFYDLVHGKKIHFYANGTPPKQTLVWKWLRFVEKNKARCCCLCERIFPTDSSTEGELTIINWLANLRMRELQTWQWEERNEGLFLGTETETKSPRRLPLFSNRHAHSKSKDTQAIV